MRLYQEEEERRARGPVENGFALVSSSFSPLHQRPRQGLYSGNRAILSSWLSLLLSVFPPLIISRVPRGWKKLRGLLFSGGRAEALDFKSNFAEKKPRPARLFPFRPCSNDASCRFSSRCTNSSRIGVEEGKRFGGIGPGGHDRWEINIDAVYTRKRHVSDKRGACFPRATLVASLRRKPSV